MSTSDRFLKEPGSSNIEILWSQSSAYSPTVSKDDEKSNWIGDVATNVGRKQLRSKSTVIDNESVAKALKQLEKESYDFANLHLGKTHNAIDKLPSPTVLNAKPKQQATPIWIHVFCLVILFVTLLFLFRPSTSK